MTTRNTRTAWLATVALAFGLTFVAGAPNASALIAPMEEMEGGGGGGGGGTGTTSPTCTPLGVANDFMSAGQGQCARPSGELATVYVHGWWFNVMYGASTWEYKAVGKNVRYLAWESFNSANTSRNQTAFKNNLDTWCAGSTKPCEIVCHSHGCLATGLLLAQYPGRWNVLKVTALQGVHGGTNLASLATSVLAPIKAGVWVLERIGVRLPDPIRALGGTGFTDMIPTNARALYNHDTATPWKTLSTNFKIPKKKCKWWNVFCHVLNFGIGVANGVLRAAHGGGNHDLLVPVMSSASSRTTSNSGKTAPCNFTRWTGHSHIATYHSSGGCTVGPNVMHTSNDKILGSAEINQGIVYTATSTSIGGTAIDCSLAEDQCNSEKDSSTSTQYGADGLAYFRSNYGYRNLLNSSELAQYVAAGGSTLEVSYLPYSESTSSTSTSSGGSSGGGSGSYYY